MTQLYNFLKEAIKLQDREARSILMSGMDELLDIFEKNNWELRTPLLGAFLNVVYKSRHNIQFILASPDQDETRKWDYDLVSAGQTLLDGKILVYISNKAGKIFTDTMKDEEGDKREVFVNGPFMDELLDVLQHELVHREQWKRAGKFWIPKKYKGKNIPIRRYLSAPQEIEAWAHDAALAFLKKDDPEEIGIYKEQFGTKHPVFKRFMKKFYKFIGELKARKHEKR
jgi:hypothetical protein